jgi:hypothetical protein
MTNDDLREVIERLARIETSLENYLEHNKDHEDRLRSVETRQRFLQGASGVFAAVLGFLGYHVTLH